MFLGYSFMFLGYSLMFIGYSFTFLGYSFVFWVTSAFTILRKTTEEKSAVILSQIADLKHIKN